MSIEREAVLSLSIEQERKAVWSVREAVLSLSIEHEREAVLSMSIVQVRKTHTSNCYCSSKLKNSIEFEY